MNLEDFTKQTRMESEKPSGWAYDFEAMKAYEKERMKSAEEFSMGILDEERKVTEEGLKTDKLFLDATKIAYKQMYGKMLEGSEEEIASQGMQLVSDALIPLTTVEGAGMLGIYKHFNEAHPEAKQALYYMIDSIDKKDMTFDGFVRGVKSIGKDPTTYTGVGLTYSFFGKTAAKASAKKELMKMLGEASLAGGAYMGVEEGLRQDLQGKQDLGEIATQAGIGAVAGPVMIGGVKAIGAGGKKALTGIADFMQNTEQELMRMAGGGTPTQDFYSVAQEAINTMPNRMSGSDFKNYLLKKGVKQDELTHSGIEEAFSKDVITKQEAMDMMSNPTLSKTVKDTEAKPLAAKEFFGIEDDKWASLSNEQKSNYVTEMLNHPQYYKNANDNTKFRSYSTKDVGTNYREELTTLDGKKMQVDSGGGFEVIKNNGEMENNINGTKDYLLMGKNGKIYGFSKSKEELEGRLKDGKLYKDDLANNFKSSHWDEANVLYHTRKQDTTIDGDKTLLVEEIQSDWHQKGRKEGYKGNMPQEKLERVDTLKSQIERHKKNMKLFKERGSEVDVINAETRIDNAERELRKLMNEGTPQAPYSKTWHEKAMKDTISEAVDKGYDRVAWVVGKTQADRYSLAKQISELRFKKISDDGYQIYADGQTLGRNVTEKELPNLVGKEMAQKIVKDANREDYKTYSGLDLEVGGEGMKGFYDKILPDFTSKYIKKYDSSLEKKKLKNGDEVWSFKVTDKMKKDIKEKGQPLYSVGGAVAGASLLKDNNE